MKKTKIFLKVVLLLLVSFCIYAQYIKIQFDKIYQNRSNYGILYNDIYSSNKLELIKPLLFNHFDATITSNKGVSIRNFKLYYINEITKDSLIQSAAEYLIKKGFYHVELVYKNGNRDRLKFSKTFLKYKHIPTFHYLIFSENFEYKYKFASNDDWFFHSSDIEPDDSIFLDFRPEWILPYFEAFDFFRKNANMDSNILNLNR